MFNANLLADISVVQAFPSSKHPSAPLLRKPPDFYSTLSLQYRTSHSAYNDKVNKYRHACNTNGVSFLRFIMEAKFFIHPSFSRRFSKASFYTMVLSIPCSHHSHILPHLSDADISTVHLHLLINVKIFITYKVSG